MPIPLGGIVVNRKLSIPLQQKLNRVMKRSVEFAFEHSEETWPFVKQYAQAMEDSVMESHINLYVNQFTRELGTKGKEAIAVLYGKAVEQGVIKPIQKDIFVD